jgi:hypothetical protein
MKAGSGTEHRTIVDPVPREPEAFLFRPSPARMPHRQRHVIGYYEDSPYGGEILVHATLPLNVDTSEDHDSRSWICPRSIKRPRSCTVA